MPMIKVDDEVLKTLAARGKFGDKYNDLIRDALGLPRNNKPNLVSGKARRGMLAPLLEAGALGAGETVTWHRARIGDTLTATVSTEGFLQTDDGQLHLSPDACSSALAGYPCKGWTVWRTASGKTLQQLRDHFEENGTTNIGQ